MFKFHKEKTILFVITVILMFSFTISYGICEAKYKFNLTCADPLWGDGGVFSQFFAQSVRYASAGDIEIKLYMSGEWGGSEEEYLQSIQLGTLDLACISTSPISQYTNVLAVYDTPFLFKNIVDEIFFTFESLTKFTPFAEKKLKEASKEAKFIVLAVAPAGRRDVFANKPVNSLEELKGLKIRTMSNEIQVDAFKFAGANAVPLPFSECFSSLQLKVIDAMENSPNVYLTNRFYEVAPYWIGTNHYTCTQTIVMSKKAWDSLPPAYQGIIQNCAISSAYMESVWAFGAADAYLKGPVVAKAVKQMVYPSLEDQKKLREIVLPKLLDKYSKSIGIDVLEILGRNDDIIKTWVEKNK